MLPPSRHRRHRATQAEWAGPLRASPSASAGALPHFPGHTASLQGKCSDRAESLSANHTAGQRSLASKLNLSSQQILASALNPSSQWNLAQSRSPSLQVARSRLCLLASLTRQRRTANLSSGLAQGLRVGLHVELARLANPTLAGSNPVVR